MKTIVDNATNTSRYLLADDKQVFLTPTKIEVGDPPNLDFIILDLNSNNATVIENVTEPTDWFGCKYFCASDGTWTEDDNWVDPRIIEDDPNLD